MIAILPELGPKMNLPFPLVPFHNQDDVVVSDDAGFPHPSLLPHWRILKMLQQLYDVSISMAWLQCGSVEGG